MKKVRVSVVSVWSIFAAGARTIVVPVDPNSPRTGTVSETLIPVLGSWFHDQLARYLNTMEDGQAIYFDQEGGRHDVIFCVDGGTKSLEDIVLAALDVAYENDCGIVALPVMRLTKDMPEAIVRQVLQVFAETVLVFMEQHTAPDSVIVVLDATYAKYLADLRGYLSLPRA